VRLSTSFLLIPKKRCQVTELQKRGKGQLNSKKGPILQSYKERPILKLDLKTRAVSQLPQVIMSKLGTIYWDN
jgi:hypothetical protein